MDDVIGSSGVGNCKVELFSTFQGDQREGKDSQFHLAVHNVIQNKWEPSLTASRSLKVTLNFSRKNSSFRVSWFCNWSKAEGEANWKVLFPNLIQALGTDKWKKNLGIKFFLCFCDRCRSVSEIGAGRELPNKKYKGLSLSKDKAVHPTWAYNLQRCISFKVCSDYQCFVTDSI